MQLTLEADELGRLICSLADGATWATATASNVPEAGRELRDAVDQARTTGTGECWWQEQGGVYWWMFRRQADQLTVAVLWSHGTITGWEHVFRSECDLEWFAGRVADELARLGRIS